LHKKSGKIENEAFLNLPKVKGAKAPKQVLKMAEAGLKIIYLQMYGPLSMLATEMHISRRGSQAFPS
jgi:hypothetical protein